MVVLKKLVSIAYLIILITSILGIFVCLLLISKETNFTTFQTKLVK